MMSVITWMVTGLGGGWLARRLLGRGREFGLAGDLVAGTFGAVLGGWLVRRAGVVLPEGHVGHVFVAFAGAAFLLVTVRQLRRAVGPHSAAAAGTGAPWTGVEHQLRRLSEMEQRVWRAVLSREASTRDPNQVFDASSTFGERVADLVAKFGGSWTFIGLFGVIIVGWMAVNEDMVRPFDPYPFILLNLVLSCLAALQAPVIMMSQNRQSAKDRSDAQSDYAVNLRAEVEIMSLHAKVDVLREQEWVRLVALAERQQELLERLARRLDVLESE